MKFSSLNVKLIFFLNLYICVSTVCVSRSDEYPQTLNCNSFIPTLVLELIKTIYWKLEVISCVLVMRNKFWFANVLPQIETFWNTLIKEREDGSYKDRYSKKRKLKMEDEKSKSDFPKPGCLIKL